MPNKVLSTLLSVFTGLCLHLTADASTTATSRISCPIDGTPIKITEMASMTVVGHRADLSKIGFIGPLYASQVQSCPKCHFAGTLADFKKPLAAPLKQKLLKDFAGYRPGQTLDDLEETDLALQLYVWQNRPALEIVELALIGSYLAAPELVKEMKYRQTAFSIDQSLPKSLSKRRYYQTLTALYIEKAFSQKQVAESDRAIYAYLAAEMYRRLGRFDKAATWFQSALKSVPAEQTGFKDMIQKQMAMTKAQNADDTI